jgi:hypothetical protein
MFNPKSSNNIIHNVLGNKTILSECSKNLFYSLLQNNTDYSIIEDNKQPFIATLHDNPISLSQKIQNIKINYHVNSIVFIHAPAPEPLKKEDKHILSEKLNDTTKIFFSKAIENSWSLKNNVYTIPYGMNILQKEKTKNVLVINTNKNTNIEKLYSHIKNLYNDCDIINNITDYKFSMDYISQYKILISLENHYDSLFGAACGCFVISNNLSDINLPSITYINNSSNIIEAIKNLLSLKDDISIQTSQKYIEQNYPIDKFYTSLNSIFSNFNNKAFIYAA